MLEIGTGSGGIADYFATNELGLFDVEAVDVCDNRLLKDTYKFTEVDGTLLPFSDGAFDVVISNHVIEHVGGREAQCSHLAELKRVLDRSGVAYLAVPNRWMLVEPHFRLAFLSWLPEPLRTPYLRLFGKGKEYDCRPLSRYELENMMRSSGLRFEQQVGRALRLTYDLEAPNSVLYRRIFRHMPDRIYDFLGGIFPTLIYVIRH